jgi:glycosyltransferase involved in cell wall biosynthesis
MRILHVIQSVDPRGGGPIAGIHQLAGADRRCTHQIVSLDAPESSQVRESPTPAVGVGPSGILGYSRHLVPWMRKNAPRYDLVCIHGLWRYCSVGTRLGLKNLAVPYLVQPHGMLDPWFNEQFPLKRLKKNFFWRWTEYRVLRDAAAVVFTCEEERIRSRRSFSPYACREHVIPYGISVPESGLESMRGQFIAAYPQLADKRLLLYLSRIHPKKGCDLLIDAFAETARDSDLHLVMAGPDDIQWSERLRARAAELGIAERITWTGMLSGDVKWGAFLAADAFILPSHQENFGIAVAEALGMGLPVLLATGVQIWREITAAGAGFAEPDDLAGTRALIRQWLALTADERSAMRDRARECYRTHYSIDGYVERIHALVARHAVQSGSFASLRNDGGNPPALS